MSILRPDQRQQMNNGPGFPPVPLGVGLGVRVLARCRGKADASGRLDVGKLPTVSGPSALRGSVQSEANQSHCSCSQYMEGDDSTISQAGRTFLFACLCPSRFQLPDGFWRGPIKARRQETSRPQTEPNVLLLASN